MVPSSAIKSQADGSKYVEILENEQPVTKIVVTGESNDTMTEIISGLVEGESVITQKINSSNNTNSNSSSKNSNSNNSNMRMMMGPM